MTIFFRQFQFIFLQIDTVCMLLMEIEKYKQHPVNSHLQEQVGGILYKSNQGLDELSGSQFATCQRLYPEDNT